MPLKRRVQFCKCENDSSQGGINRTCNIKSLTNQQSEQLAQVRSDLQQKQEKLESAIADFNANLNEMWAELVADNIHEYNKTVTAAQEFIDQTREEIQNYYDARSESWQSSARGTSFNSFLEEWDISLEEIDIDFPDEADVPEFEAIEQLDELPEEPG